MSSLESQQKSPSPQDNIDILEILGNLWRSKWVLAFFVFACAGIGGFYAYFVAVPKYQASTTLALQVRGPQVVDLEDVFSGVSSESAAMNTELVVIRSRGLLRKVVEEIDLIKEPEFNPSLRPPSPYSFAGVKSKLRNIIRGTPSTAPTPLTGEAAVNVAINRLRGAVSASVVRGTYVFQISVTSEDPWIAQSIANTLAQTYVSDQIDVKFQATENAVSWLTERVVDLEREVAEKQNVIKALQVGINTSSVAGINALNQRVRDMQERVDRSLADLADVSARRREFQSVRNTGDMTEIARVFSDSILTQLLERADAVEDLEGTFMARADSILSELEQSELRLAAQTPALEQALRDVEAEANKEFDQFARFQRAEQDLNASTRLLETFVARLKETTVQRGLQQADSRVLSAATVGSYISPRKSRILMMWTMIGVVLGVAFALVRQYLYSGFRSTTELEQVMMQPVIGQTLIIKKRTRRAIMKYLVDHPTSAAVEAVRNLRTSLLMANLDNPPKVIMSTSSIPGEGKTTNSLALAYNLAGTGKKVLVIEGDLRRQTLFEYFDVPRNQPGMLKALSGEESIESVIHSDELMGIDVIFGEESEINAADVLSSSVFKSFLDHLRDRYDYVIIDTPPVLAVSDPRILGQYADAILFNVAWNKTSQYQVKEAMRLLDTVNIKVSGFVLSQVDGSKMQRYGYGSAYGGYSSYGNHYYNS